MLGLGHRDVHGHPAVGYFLGAGRHGGELEESQFVQPPLAQLDRRQTEAVPGLERERTRDDVVTHAHVAAHCHRAIQRIGPRRRPQRECDLFGWDRRFFGRHQRERIPAILERARRHCLSGRDLRPVHQRSGLERQPAAQRLEGPRPQHVEAFEPDALDEPRFAFVDRNGDADRVLGVAQLCFERGDLRVGVSAILVVQLDAAEIGVEHCAVEIALAAPGYPAARLGAQHRLDAPGPKLVGTFNLEAGDLDPRCRRAGNAARIRPRRQPVGRLRRGRRRRLCGRRLCLAERCSARDGRDQRSGQRVADAEQGSRHQRDPSEAYQGCPTASSERTSLTPVV